MCALMRASSFIVVCCPMLQVCSLNVLFVNTTIRSLNVFCCKYHYTIIGSLCLKVRKQPSLRCVRTDCGWIYIDVNTGCVLSHVSANKPVQCSTQPVSVSSYKKQKSCSVPKVTLVPWLVDLLLDGGFFSAIRGFVFYCCSECNRVDILFNCWAVKEHIDFFCSFIFSGALL